MPAIVRDQKLFEQEGKTLGLDITANYQFFPTGSPVIQGLAGGSLDLGDMGTTPMLGLIDQGQKIVPLMTSIGKLRFLLVVRKGSSIRNVQDLKGKRIGLTVGTDQEFFLDNIARSVLGADSAKAAFTLVNLQTPTQAASMPNGIDAAVTVSTAYLPAHDKYGTEAIVNSYGTTEDYYQGPAGSGAGRMLPGADASPFAPEAFLAHRGFWVMSEKMFAEHPKVAQAWIQAQQLGLEAANKLSVSDRASKLSDVLTLNQTQAASVISDDLMATRGWVWLTRGEGLIVYLSAKARYASGQMKTQLSWADTVTLFSQAAAQAQAAYDLTDKTPTEADFTKATNDLRGPPNWKSSTWKQPTN